MDYEAQIDKDDTSDESMLTEWKNEPTVKALGEDLLMATPAHDAHVTKVKEWLDLRNIEGKAKPKTKKNHSQVQPKLIRRQAEWRYSALSEPFLSADEMCKVSPKTFEDKEAAEQNALVLNWQFRTKLNRVKFIDEYVRTGVDEGTVAVRVGWDRETKKVKKTVPTYEFYPVQTQEQIDMLEQGIRLKQQNPNEFANLPAELMEAVEYTIETKQAVIAIQNGEAEVEEEVVVRNQPTLDILHYENLFLDPSAEGNIDKANFAVLSFETSKAELIKDGRYKNLKKVNFSTNTPLTTPDHASELDASQEFKDELRRRIVAYEYWGWYDVNGDDTLVPIVATWIGNTMIRMEANPFPDEKLPIVIVPYLPLKRSITGEPDAELLSENQAILGAVTRGMIDLMGRSANGQTGYAKGMLDVVNKRRFESGADYEFNPNISPAIGFHSHKYPEIPNSALQMLQIQNSEAEALTGVKAFSGGLSGEAYGEVAAGIKGMLDASSKREMAILRRLAQGISEIGQKIVSMNQVFLSEEEVVRVTNKEFKIVRREDIQGEFDLEVDITTAEIDEAQAQDLSFMLQTMGSTMELPMVQMILSEIAKLKRMPALAQKILDFQPTPNPAAEEAQQLENAKLKAEIQEIESKINWNNARARAEASSADQADLDFVEQETGTKHARDIDKQKAQAEGNSKLEIIKSLVDTESPGNIIDAINYGSS